MNDREYIHYGHDHFDVEIFDTVSNHGGLWVKPGGGLWASPVDAEFGWKDWNHGSKFVRCDDNNSFTFRLSDEARVLVIDSDEILDGLPQRKEEYKRNMWCLLDFEKISEDYDAIELVLSADSRLYWSLYGWDCDCILVMNPNVVVEVVKCT